MPRGKTGEISRALETLIRYMDSGEAGDDYTEKLNREVTSIRMDEKWRHDFMTPAPLIIADGALHTAKQRKHKNPAHLEFLGMPVETDRKSLTEGADDSEIAEICRRYEKLLGNGKNPLDKEP